MQSIIISLIVILFGVSVLGEINIDENGVPLVKLAKNGPISGVVKLSREGRPFYSFKGIPYATIPERFQAAKPIVESWKGIKPAVEQGSICTQKAFDLSGPTLGSEACLNLNVYVPVLNATKSL